MTVTSSLAMQVCLIRGGPQWGCFSTTYSSRRRNPREQCYRRRQPRGSKGDRRGTSADRIEWHAALNPTLLPVLTSSRGLGQSSPCKTFSHRLPLPVMAFRLAFLDTSTSESTKVPKLHSKSRAHINHYKVLLIISKTKKMGSSRHNSILQSSA